MASSWLNVVLTTQHSNEYSESSLTWSILTLAVLEFVYYTIFYMDSGLCAPVQFDALHAPIARNASAFPEALLPYVSVNCSNYLKGTIDVAFIIVLVELLLAFSVAAKFREYISLMARVTRRWTRAIEEDELDKMKVETQLCAIIHRFLKLKTLVISAVVGMIVVGGLAWWVVGVLNPNTSLSWNKFLCRTSYFQTSALQVTGNRTEAAAAEADESVFTCSMHGYPVLSILNQIIWVVRATIVVRIVSSVYFLRSYRKRRGWTIFDEEHERELREVTTTAASNALHEVTDLVDVADVGDFVVRPLLRRMAREAVERGVPEGIVSRVMEVDEERLKEVVRDGVRLVGTVGRGRGGGGREVEVEEVEVFVDAEGD